MNKTRKIAFGGLIAALYVVMTAISSAFGLASGVIQIRLSESLCLLPCMTSAAIPGLAVGCVLANLITGCLPLDIVFGSLATLIGAIGTRLMKKTPQWAWIPPVVSNALIIPPVLMHVYGAEEAWWFLVLTVGAGELISCALIGMVVYELAQKANRGHSLT